jgi:hypothetical protein
MTTKKKPALKRVPSKKKNVNLDELNSFAAGAEGRSRKKTSEKASPTKTKPEYPWEDPLVREDVKKAINLQLPEPLYLKLRFAAKEGRISQQKFLRNIITPAVEKKIKEITK